MTNAELLAKIKDFANEQKDLLGGFELQSDFRRGETAAYSAVISFLSTLESEKPMNPDDAMKKLDEKIALVKERGTWKGVDVDKFMDEVRGREPVCEELEKELDEFLKDHVFGKLINRNAGLALARHFAEWQSKQDKETIELAEDHAYLAGSVNEREQMMKEAIHCVVQDDLDSHGASYNIPFIRLGIIALKPKGIGVGDKVRIIIVKED
jgi:hypothetical protein